MAQRSTHHAKSFVAYGDQTSRFPAALWTKVGLSQCPQYRSKISPRLSLKDEQTCLDLLAANRGLPSKHDNIKHELRDSVFVSILVCLFSMLHEARQRYSACLNTLKVKENSHDLAFCILLQKIVPLIFYTLTPWHQ